MISLTSILGVFFVLGFGFDSERTVSLIIPITIGGFLYIANADLIPELHKDVKPLNSVIQLLSFLAGVGVMLLLLLSPPVVDQAPEPSDGLAHESTAVMLQE